LAIVLTARRHCCIACGGDVCFIDRLAPTPETRTHLQPLLSLHLRLCRIVTFSTSLHTRQAHPKCKRQTVLRLSSALSCWLLTLNPFLSSYRCLSFPRPPSDTRASRCTLANKRSSSLARPGPEQDFYSLSRANPTPDPIQACYSLTRRLEQSPTVFSIDAESTFLLGFKQSGILRNPISSSHAPQLARLAIFAENGGQSS
jgi:hypothetical protein